jgi:hypothetical protein
MNHLTFRQGDVLLREVEALPEDATLSEERIVARGEHTDHSHIVYGEAARIYHTLQGEMYVDTREGAAIIRHVLESRHQQGIQIWTGEHRTLLLPHGKVYQIKQQSEYDPYSRMMWGVMD